MLVVDDDPGVADLYRRLLERKMPVEVSSAADADTARRKFSDSEYDVVTIDCRLPDESGLDLLTLAETGQVPTEVEEVEVAEVVDGVLHELDAGIKEKGVLVKAGGDLGRIRGSRAQLFQLFYNLVGNAVVHNDSPEPPVEITCLVAERGRHGYLVRDNGFGITEEHLDNIFNLFYKGADGGSGVGLATVEGIARAYDGSVRAYNDGGACFEVHLRDISRGAQAESGG